MADDPVDLATVWDQARERLASSLTPQQKAVLNLTRPLGLFEDTAVLAAPNEFTQTVLESRMRIQLAEALSAEFGRAIRAVENKHRLAACPDHMDMGRAVVIRVDHHPQTVEAENGWHEFSLP